MKKHILILLISILFISCEDVVNVDLNTAEPRLVIDASINWEKGTTGNHQIIKLSTTTGYYNPLIPVVSGATVFVKNSSNTTFNFIEEVPNSGVYVCNDFIPVINETYFLTVITNGETYTASEKLIASPEISGTEQRDDIGFNGDDIGVKIFFQDNPNENNSYLLKYVTSVNAFPEFEVFDDRFTQGNEMFGLYSHEDLESGNVIDITLYGISEDYYNYMNILLSISGGNAGSPFQTPPSKVHGNIINQTNFDNYALGFFRLCEIDKLAYTVQ